MSSDQQIPPLVQEQLAKLQQTQQNFQSIQMQKQQLESEKHETEKALEELILQKTTVLFHCLLLIMTPKLKKMVKMGLWP